MSDTDLRALRKQFEQHLRREVRGSVVGHDAGDVGEAAWNFIKDQFEIAVPRETYERASTNVARLQEQTKALPSVEEIALLLESVMYMRGHDRRVWPEDEVAEYDIGAAEQSFDAGLARARLRIFQKAAEKIGQRIDIRL